MRGTPPLLHALAFKRSLPPNCSCVPRYLEVYNEQFFDLLNPGAGMLDDLAVREDDQGAG